MSSETFEEKNLTFRLATMDDLPKIMAFVDIFLRRDWLVRRDYLADKLKAPEKYQVWMVLDEGKLVGWGVCGGTRKTLYNLLVHPKYRGRHIGEMLVEKLQPEIIRSKLDQSTGDPTEFYKKIGYRVVAEKQGKRKTINILEKKKPQKD